MVGMCIKDYKVPPGNPGYNRYIFHLIGPDSGVRDQSIVTIEKIRREDDSLLLPSGQYRAVIMKQL